MPRGIPKAKVTDPLDALRASLGPTSVANRDDPVTWAGRYAPSSDGLCSPERFPDCRCGPAPHTHSRHRPGVPFYVRWDEVARSWRAVRAPEPA